MALYATRPSIRETKSSLLPCSEPDCRRKPSTISAKRRLTYHLGEVAEQHLFEARRLAPTHVAVLIGLYRFYFYKNRLEDTLEIAKTCLTRAAIDNSLPLDWREVQKGDADFANYEAVMPRFFMFVLKGYAYLQLRLGEYEEGREAAQKLLELDPTDKVGATLLLSVLAGMEAEDVD